MLLTDFPELRLQHDEELALLRVEWVGGNNMARFRAGSAHLLHLGRTLHPRHCLLDMNSLPDISAYDQIWLGMKWLPGLLKLPLARVVFLLDHGRVYQQATIETLLHLTGSLMKFDLQFFDDARPALNWLTDDSARVAGLLAEWDAPPAPFLAAPVSQLVPARTNNQL